MIPDVPREQLLLAIGEYDESLSSPWNYPGARIDRRIWSG